jgi:subtilisin-like proprotein convertase family protein
MVEVPAGGEAPPYPWREHVSYGGTTLYVSPHWMPEADMSLGRVRRSRVDSALLRHPVDTLYSEASHLDEIEVRAAWFDGYFGEAVHLLFLDDGVDVHHYDLSYNFNQTYSRNLATNPVSTSPDPPSGIAESPRLSHGTAMASVAVGANNIAEGAALDSPGQCAVGVAPRATFSAVRLPLDSLTDVLEADALDVSETPEVDIVVGGFGPIDDGRRLEAPGPLAASALLDGVTNGRGGLGVIYVWPAGNGAALGDNCNYDGYAASPYTLTVAAHGASGGVTDYSEPCSATLVSAPSSSGDEGIVAADILGTAGVSDAGCTSDFGGTSAAAAQVAGAVALLLSKAPTLHWLDVYGILAYSATPSGDPAAIETGAGLTFDSYLGFGKLSVNAALQVADAWTPYAGVSKYESGILTTPSHIVSVGGYAKVVTARLTSSIAVRGNLEVSLSGPSGTKAVLAEAHDDPAGGGYFNWTFSTMAFWDEDIAGSWYLNLGTANAGTLVEWELGVHHTSNSAASLAPFTATPFVDAMTPAPATPTPTTPPPTPTASPGCASLGATCGTDSFCCSGKCVGQCQASCVDGVRNQGEFGVDCGGPCPNNCFGIGDGATPAPPTPVTKVTTAADLGSAAIPRGSQWRYSLGPFTEADRSWSEPDFDDSRWRTAAGAFGTAYPNVTAPLPYGTRYAYFRSPPGAFALPSGVTPALINRTYVFLAMDDAVDAYVNGFTVATYGLGGTRAPSLYWNQRVSVATSMLNFGTNATNVFAVRLVSSPVSRFSFFDMEVRVLTHADVGNLDLGVNDAVPCIGLTLVNCQRLCGVTGNCTCYVDGTVDPHCDVIEQTNSTATFSTAPPTVAPAPDQKKNRNKNSFPVTEAAIGGGAFLLLCCCCVVGCLLYGGDSKKRVRRGRGRGVDMHYDGGGTAGGTQLYGRVGDAQEYSPNGFGKEVAQNTGGGAAFYGPGGVSVGGEPDEQVYATGEAVGGIAKGKAPSGAPGGAFYGPTSGIGAPGAGGTMEQVYGAGGPPVGGVAKGAAAGGGAFYGPTSTLASVDTDEVYSSGEAVGGIAKGKAGAGGAFYGPTGGVEGGDGGGGGGGRGRSRRGSRHQARKSGSHNMSGTIAMAQESNVEWLQAGGIPDQYLAVPYDAVEESDMQARREQSRNGQYQDLNGDPSMPPPPDTSVW